MQPYPRAPDLVWPGHLHGTGCLSARAVGTGFPTVGLRLWLGPGCGWSWVLFTPARCGWGLGWVCLGSVCGVVPLLPAVCGVRGWALVWACFRDLCGFLRVSLAPRRFRFRCAVWAPGSRLCPALLGWVVGLCFLRFFVFFFFSGCWVSLSRALWSFPVSFPFGGCWLFFFFFLLVSVSLFSGGPLSLAWCCRSWLGGPPVPVWGSCLRCPLGGGFGPLLCCWWAVWWLWAVFARPPPPPPFFFFLFGGGGPAGLFLPLPSLGWRLLCGWCVVWLVPRHSWQRFLCATPRHSWLGFAAGGCGRSPPLLAGVCRRWWCLVCGGGVLVGLWLMCGVVGPSPLLAEVPVCYSPPLLAGFRFRWCWAGPATPGWGPLAALLCGVWCVAVVCWWGCGWCVVWLVPRHSWRRFLCATPRQSWLGFAASGGGRSPPLLAGVRLRRWCVVCGVWCVAVVCGWGCGWCVVWLVPRHSWRRFLCATPRHSWLGFASGGGGRSPPLLAGVRWRRCCVVCGVWRWCVGGVVAGVWCGWSLATPGGGSCVLLPATPGWVSLPVVVGGPRHSWLGSTCGGGVWCVVCGVWRWCVGGVVAGVWCGWSLATPGGGSCVLLPASLGWVSLPVVVGGPRHSWLGSVGGVAVWCVVCGTGVLVGLRLACGVVGPSPLLAVVPVCYSPPLLAGFRCQVVGGPRHSWLGSACGGGVWCVVCGVWRWCVGGVVAGVWCGWSLATPGGGSCVLLPATPGWVSLPLVVGGPRHSWLGSFGGGGVWCVVGVPRHSWRRFLCATPRHSWLGFAAAGGGRSPPLLAGVRWRRWCACFAWPGRAGRPPGRVVVRLTFSFGRFVFLLCLAPSGLGLPPSPSLLLPFLVGWGLWCVGWLLLGTCSCAVVLCVLCALSGFVAPGGRRCLAPVRVPWLWLAACLSGVPRGPAWCAAPRPVRSLSVLRSAFPTPWCLSPPRVLAPPALLGGCAGHAEAGREPGSLCLPLAPAEAGALGSPRRTRSGPRDGVVPGGSLRRRSWAACAAVVGVCGPGH